MDHLFGGILLLVTGALIGNSLQEEQLKVYMTTKLTQVVEGDSVTVKCNFQPHGKYKVSWYYSETQHLNCDSNKIPEHHRFKLQISDAWSKLCIPSVQTNDSGWYFCKIFIDIPVLKERCSDGTQILVVEANTIVDLNLTQLPASTACTSATTRDGESQPSIDLLSESTPGQESTLSVESVSYASTTPTLPWLIGQWWIWFALAVGIAVLVVTIVVLIISTRKNKDLIYENTQPEESGCWRRKKKKQDICSFPPSKKIDTIKPLKKYDAYSNNRTRRL